MDTRLIVIVALLGLSCAAAPIRPLIKGNTTMSNPVSAQGLPDELKMVTPLWEEEHLGSVHKAASRTRLYPDGRLYGWSNTKRSYVNKKLQRLPAPYAWRLDAKVSPEGITKITALICYDFVKLPSATPATVASDQSFLVLHGAAKGCDHRVTLPSSPTVKLPPTIQAIQQAIQAHIIPEGVPLDQPE